MTEYPSPLRYPGGKARAIPEIAPFFPDIEKINEYREPFIGGGSVFLYLKEMYGPYYPEIKWWVNDLEPYLYNFWVMLQENVFELSERIEHYSTVPMSSIRLLKQNSDIDNAAIYYIKSKSTFGGMALKQIDRGNYLRFKESYEKNKDKNSDNLTSVNKIMRGTKITNLDYRALFDDADSGNIFMFLDPPYFKAKSLYGGSEKYNLHDKFDHYTFSNLVAKLATNNNVKFMITYDDCQTIRHLYSKIDGVKIIPFQVRYTMSSSISSGKRDMMGHEIMIVNYKTENVITKQSNLFSF